MGLSRHLFRFIFGLFKQFYIKNCRLKGFRTRIVGVEGNHADHLTTTTARIAKRISLVLLYLILSKLVLDHAGVGSSIFLDDSGDLKGSIWQLSDSLILRNRLTSHFPVKLRARVTNRDARKLQILFDDRDEVFVERRNLCGRP